MKKMYIRPQTEAIKIEMQTILAGSGPGGGAAIAPGMGGKEGGPGSDGYGNTPTTSARRSGSYYSNNSDIWEDED